MPFLIIIPALLVLLLLGLLFSIYLKVFHNKRRPKVHDAYAGLKSEYLEGMRDVIRAHIDELSTYPCEKIEQRAYDKTRLFARLYQGKEGMPTVIMFHGYRGASDTEMSGAALMSIAHGLGVLIVDQRAHGRSAGGTVSFGIKERRDVLTWVNYLTGRFGKGHEIFLYGISMGAATVLMASELLSHATVRGIIADCPFSTGKDIITRVMQNRGLNPKRVYPFVYLAALVFGRFRLNGCSSVSAVGNTDIPILLIHGKSDNFVPFEMSEKIKSAAKNAELYPVEGAGHGASFAVAKENYVYKVLSFIDKYTQKGENEV